MYSYMHDSIGSQRPLAHPGPPQPPPLHMPDRVSHQHSQQTAPYMIPQSHHIPPSHQPPHLPLVGSMQQHPPLQQQPPPEMATQPETEEKKPPPPTPPPFRTVCDGRIWELEVCQQPVRARMCGFGDKDRRPITPPPCIRLIVKDELTGKEVNVNDIDTSYYILTVDIFDEAGKNEMNIVKTANSGSPSISASSTIGLPPSAINANPPYPPSATNSVYYSPSSAQPASANSYQSANSFQGGYPSAPSSAYSQQFSPQQFPPRANGYQPPGMNSYAHQLASPTTPIGPYNAQFTNTARPYSLQPPPNESPNSAFTRNLIGSLSASAFRLHDDQEKHGVWFVMQDLSVRTEGNFRLKFNFMNLSEQAGSDGQPGSNPQPLNGASAVTPTSPHSATTASQRPNYAPATQQNTQLNTGFAPVLAYAFSEIFQVFSAKRFPGVIESTGLSRTFAAQGIKIPIRKDNEQKNGNGKRPRRDGEEDDDGDDEE